MTLPKILVASILSVASIDGEVVLVCKWGNMYLHPHESKNHRNYNLKKKNTHRRRTDGDR